MKHLLNALICSFMIVINVHAQIPKTNVPDRIIGCWNSAESKQWEYGFFEKFAVYNNDFWEYKSLIVNKNKIEMVLKKGNEILKIKLNIDAKSDSVCTLVANKGTKKHLIRYASHPDFTTEDHTSFINNGYQTDSVTIIGYFNNTHRTLPFKINVPNALSGEGDYYYTDIDSLGRFRITIPILNSTEIYMDWQREGTYIPTVVEPGETLFLYYDYKNEDTRFMGKNARIHQELRNYDIHPPYKQWRKYLSYDEKMDHDVYLQKQQELYNEEKEILDRYIHAHPFLSDKFKYYTSKGLLMKHATSLMQRRFLLRRNWNKEQFSKRYMDYVHKIYSQIPVPYTLHDDIMDFLNDYYDYHNNLKASNTSSSPLEILRHLDKEGQYPLTEQQRTDFDAYEKGSSINFLGQYFKIDSLEIDLLTAPYKEKMLRTACLLKDSAVLRIISEYNALAPELMELRNIKDKLICFDSINAPLTLKEFVVTANTYKHLYHQKKALSGICFDFFNTQVTNEALRGIIAERQEYYTALAKQTLDYTESLKKTDYLKDCEDADELLHQMIEPYKGKVIYIDIWGTWCGPCKEKMKYMPAIKEAMKDKDVLFMYLANNSPETSWKNVIKELHLTGSSVVHYNLPDKQQSMLEQHLSVKYFPTFILIDKEGNIVDTNAPDPSRKQELIEKLEKLLAK